MRIASHTLREKLIPLLTTFLAVLVSSQLFSQENLVEENSRQLHVRYLEGDNEALHFNLKYNNSSGNDFKLMVLNETGEILFQNRYSGKNFKKKIKMARLTDSDDVTFLIRSPKENIQLSYKVKITSKVMDASPAAN
jgi:hypothetical protein